MAENPKQPLVATTRTGERSAAIHPAGWYPVVAAHRIRRGRILGREIAGRRLVVFRGRDSGQVSCLDAHCSHMGTHLRHGDVIGDCLRCPLHHWTYDGAGTCIQAGSGPAPPFALQTAWPTVEKYGLVWVWPGHDPILPEPRFDGLDRALRFRVGRPVTIDAPWYTIAGNAFDSQHFLAVHRRDLVGAPETRRTDEGAIELNFQSLVVGTSIADRVMKWISKNQIEVRIREWGGTIVTVRSKTARTEQRLLLGLEPRMLPDRRPSTLIYPVVGVPRKVPGVDHAVMRVAAWLFTSFLAGDSRILSDIRFAPPWPLPAGEPLASYLDYVHDLPPAWDDAESTQ